ncbi:hypothetical protein [Chamaesiphon minutus]|nr:hypothetical protein [Chamaesiphon minutus]
MFKCTPIDFQSKLPQGDRIAPASVTNQCRDLVGIAIFTVLTT